jgi:hypothetical protein
VPDDKSIPDDLTVGHAAADHDVVAVLTDTIVAGDAGDVHQGFYRPVQATPDLYQQIRTTANHPGPAVMAL